MADHDKDPYDPGAQYAYVVWDDNEYPMDVGRLYVFPAPFDDNQSDYVRALEFANERRWAIKRIKLHGDLPLEKQL